MNTGKHWSTRMIKWRSWLALSNEWLAWVSQGIVLSCGSLLYWSEWWHSRRTRSRLRFAQARWELLELFQSFLFGLYPRDWTCLWLFTYYLRCLQQYCGYRIWELFRFMMMVVCASCLRRNAEFPSQMSLLFYSNWLLDSSTEWEKIFFWAERLEELLRSHFSHSDH